MIFCGIDIGTTNSKAILLDRDGRRVASIEYANPPKDSKVFWYDQFCKIFDSFKVQGYLEGKEVFCSVTTQGGSFIILDELLRPISPMYLWTDMSGQGNSDSYLKEFGAEDYYMRTGWNASGWLAAFKLKGINLKEGERITFVPDFIYSQLTGEIVTDITNAQITGLASFEDCCWDDSLLGWIGISRDRLPRIENDMRVLYENLDTKWGKINLVTSSHDQYAAMEALGLRSDVDIMLGTGTAWVVNSRRNKAIYDQDYKLHPGRDFVSGVYGNIATLGPIGKGFDDLLKAINLEYDSLSNMSLVINKISVPKGPLDIDIKKGFFANSDIISTADSAVVVKRYMEYSASILKHALDELGLMGDIEMISMTGGAVLNEVWPQIISDICRIKVRAVKMSELTAYGAALFAAKAAGIKFEYGLDDIAETIMFEPEGTRTLNLRIDSPKFRFVSVCELSVYDGKKRTYGADWGATGVALGAN